MKYLNKIIFLMVLSLTHTSQIFSYHYLHPIFDNRQAVGELANWRTSLDCIECIDSSFSRGLNRLNISGSSQFSENNLFMILENIPVPSSDLIVFDLRKESHGLINGQPVSWTDGIHNNGNIHLQMDEIEPDEFRRLKQAEEEGSIAIKNSEDPSMLIVEKVKTERELLESVGATYIRFPVPDRQRPSDEIVDQFISIVQGLPEGGYWAHFHCKAGRGRTTTFMILFDILKNGHELSLDEILMRQGRMGGKDLTDFTDKSEELKYFAEERLKFVENFYLYCNQVPDFHMSWSDWVLTNQLDHK